jgi:hypothetical protein
VEGVDTREDQIEALRVLSAGNTLIIVLLGGVLALQVRELNGMCLFRGEWSTDVHTPSFFFFFFRGLSRVPKGGQEWARRLEMKEVAKIAAEEAKEREGVKKDQ